MKFLKSMHYSNDDNVLRYQVYMPNLKFSTHLVDDKEWVTVHPDVVDTKFLRYVYADEDSVVLPDISVAQFWE